MEGILGYKVAVRVAEVEYVLDVPLPPRLALLHGQLGLGVLGFGLDQVRRRNGLRQRVCLEISPDAVDDGVGNPVGAVDLVRDGDRRGGSADLGTSELNDEGGKVAMRLSEGRGSGVEELEKDILCEQAQVLVALVLGAEAHAIAADARQPNGGGELDTLSLLRRGVGRAMWDCLLTLRGEALNVVVRQDGDLRLGSVRVRRSLELAYGFGTELCLDFLEDRGAGRGGERLRVERVQADVRCDGPMQR